MQVAKKPKKTYVKGGKRKKSKYYGLKKGAFTKWCKAHGYNDVQACARHVLANKGEYSKLTVQRAQFAHTEGKK